MPKPENVIGKGFDKRPENINRAGRPKTVKGITDAMRMIAENDGCVPVDCNVYEIDIRGKRTGKMFKRAELDLPDYFAIAVSIMNEARKNNPVAWNIALNRLDGKVKQTIGIEHDVVIQVNVTDQETADEINKLK